ncbi:hypothetical protein F4779DRAFT_641821 [Xylariaceae sp. FL0662B]|nr:hypothetical protein F4779DRAFT_641821 [Xylariaceae sp. FL0662B]
MAPKKDTQPTNGSAENDGGVPLTSPEFNLLDAVLKHAAMKPDVNWGAVAETAHFAGAKSARDRFRQVCKKHNWFEGAEATPVSDAATTAPDATPKKSPAKRARKAKSEDSAALGDDEAETPGKKRKIAPKKEKHPGADLEQKGKTAQHTDADADLKMEDIA